MMSDGIAVSLHSWSIFLFILINFGLCFVIGLWLLPRLSRPGRGLASVMLAAQVLVIVMSQITEPAGDFQAWQWSIGREWTIESVLSSTQFALVGLVALLISWLNKAESPWRRFYLVAMALLFLYLGLDEYFAWKNYRHDWTHTYFAFGALFATFTLIVIETSPKPARQWLIIMMLGAATVAAGGIAVDNFSLKICDINLGFIELKGCANFNILDELLELLGGWIALLAVLHRLTDFMPSATVRGGWLLYILPALWILLLLQSDAIHPLEDQIRVEPAAVEFESAAALLGYRSHLGSNNLTMNLYISPGDSDAQQLGYSLHLVDLASGSSIAGVDKLLVRHLEFYVAPGMARVYRQGAAIPLPAHKPTNRVFAIVLKIWRQEGDQYTPLQILASDHHTLNDTQVVLGETVFPPKPSSEAFGVFKNGFVLVAFDMPTLARAGDSLPIAFFWASEKDAREDHSQFLHFKHAESGEWWVYDQQPLGPRLPTRLWYRGLSDREVWNVSLPEDLEPGRYEVFTGLYRARDWERVPAVTADGRQWLDARAKLGDLTIESSADPCPPKTAHSPGMSDCMVDA